MGWVCSPCWYLLILWQIFTFFILHSSIRVFSFLFSFLFFSLSFCLFACLFVCLFSCFHHNCIPLSVLFFSVVLFCFCFSFFFFFVFVFIFVLFLFYSVFFCFVFCFSFCFCFCFFVFCFVFCFFVLFLFFCLCLYEVSSFRLLLLDTLAWPNSPDVFVMVYMLIIHIVYISLATFITHFLWYTYTCYRTLGS